MVASRRNRQEELWLCSDARKEKHLESGIHGSRKFEIGSGERTRLAIANFVFDRSGVRLQQMIKCITSKWLALTRNFTRSVATVTQCREFTTAKLAASSPHDC